MSIRIPEFPPAYDFLFHCCVAINRQDYVTALEVLKKGLRPNLESFDEVNGVDVMKHMQATLKVFEANLRTTYGCDWEQNIEVPKLTGSAKRVRCSFCEKRYDEVQRIIPSGGGVAICNECVQVCNEILSDKEKAGASERVSDKLCK